VTHLPDNAGIGGRQRSTWPARAWSLVSSGEWLVAHATTLLLVAGFGAGIGIRAFYAFRSSFPVNDGGLFYDMARDLQDANFGIPAFTRYNGGEIPFVYPPLSIYLAALGDTLTPIPLEELFSILPFAGAVFALWAFFRLASALFPTDRWTVAAATAAFGLAPRSFIWLVMGGGLPRGFGLALALLATREAYLLTTGPFNRRRVVTCGILAGLTALTHLETAAFLAFTLLLVTLLRPATGIRRLSMAGVVAIVLCAPWFLTMVTVHGLSPFFAGMHEGGRLVRDGTISFGWVESFVRNPVHTSEPYFPIIGALGVVGALYALVRGDWLVPVWWMATGILGMRAFPTYVTVATCLMAGYTVGQLLVPELARRFGNAPGGRQLLAATAVAFGVFWITATGSVSYNRGEAGVFLESLPASDQAAMKWVSLRTDEDATFAVVPADIWPADYPSEWFPALADRESLTTPQGYEWVPGAFNDRVAIHDELLACASQDAACLETALSGLGIDYIYIPAPCCTTLKASIRLSQDYQVHFDNGAMIVQLRGRALAAPPPGVSEPAGE